MSIPQSPLCAKCGAELAAFATEGLCSACLLEQGLVRQTREPAPPFSRFGDYELVEEIARGGMGIVFKARQMSLNRLVALKLISTSTLPSEELVKRFKAE